MDDEGFLLEAEWPSEPIGPVFDVCFRFHTHEKTFMKKYYPNIHIRRWTAHGFSFKNERTIQ